MARSLLFAVVTMVILGQAAAADEELFQIVVSHEDILLYNGQTILVPCVAYFHGNSTAQVAISWMKDGAPLDTDSRITTRPSVQSDVGGVQFVRGVLEVCDVGVGDTGRYSCVLSDGGVEKDREDFVLTVTASDAPTQVLIAPSDTEAPANDTILLTCVAYALPAPSISWMRNGRLLTPTTNSQTTVTIETKELVRGGVRMVRSSLEMCNVRSLASGEYACVADNTLTSSSTSFKVTIDGPIQLLSGPDSMTVQVGTNLSLTCDFHSTPNTTISWSGVPLTSAGRFKVQDTVVREEGVEFLRSVLSVTPVADYDGARIECRASNGEDVLEHSFQLTVNVPPLILVSPSSIHDTANQTLTLACLAHGASHITWQREGLEISSEKVKVTTTPIERGGRMFLRSVLELCGVGVADSGEYSCVAKSGVEKDVATFDLCIVEPTGLLVAPSDVTMVTGHTLSTACVGYTTQPNATLYWTRHNQLLFDSSKVTISEKREVKSGVVIMRSFLLMKCIDPDDTAQYGCHVTSDDVIRSAEFSITVQVPPRFKELPDTSQSVTKGGTVSFTCQAGGDPLPTVTWLKDNSPLSPDPSNRVMVRQTSVPGFDEFSQAVESVLTIEGVVEADAGEYQCEASNVAGMSELSKLHQLLVEPSVVTGGLPSVAMGIGHTSYLGAVVGFLCFLAVFIVHIVIRPLRKSPSTPTLINVCLTMMALNLSFVISYNTIHTEVGCIFFAAMFQYFFLAAMLSLTVLVAFKAIQKRDSTKRMFIYMIAFSLNWGAPLAVVVVSLTPDVTDYAQPEAGHFCAPTQWPYWLGELLPFALIHLLTWCAFFIIKFTTKSKPETGRSEWLRDTIFTASVLLLFDIAWGFGLPTTQQTNTVLHSLFIVSSATFGIVSFVIYCFGFPEARYELMKQFKHCRVPKAKTTAVSNEETPPPPVNQLANQVSPPACPKMEMLKLDEELSLSGIEAGKFIQEERYVVPQPRQIITSFSESAVEEELGLNKSGCGHSPGRQGSVRGPEVVKVQNFGVLRYALV